jgi:NitT/TauT family transport system substrate-binding protein
MRPPNVLHRWVLSSVFIICTVSTSFSAPLRIGILPDADSLPLMVAEAEGLYAKEGVEVLIVPFSNPQERDAAFQAGRLDGAISDLLAAAFFIAGGFEVRVASATDGRYGIVAAPGSGIQNAAALRGKKIGLSKNTIIQYGVDALLASRGLSMDAYDAVAVPKIPVRLEMVLAGQIDAAGLPEPMLTAAVQRGAVLVATTDEANIDAGVLLFGKAVMDTRLDEVRRFYKAYAAACAGINGNTDGYRSFLVEKAAFPAEIRTSFRFVSYRKPVLPQIQQVESVLEWLKARKLLSKELRPSGMLDGRAVQGW